MIRRRKMASRVLLRDGTPARPPAALSPGSRRCWESAPISIQCWIVNLSRPNSIDAVLEEEPPVPFALQDLLKGAGGEPPGIEVEGINADSRAIKPGDVFFAVPGLHTHGDAFAPQARSKGAVAMITDRTPAADPGMPVVVVSNVRAAYARAAARQFAPQPEVTVGVTGTNGKSSIVSFVRQIWLAAGFNAASVGTVGVETRDGLIPGELTTPDPLSLHRDLGKLRAQGIDHVAMEASS